jgi:SAM-dependent methyltransferase
MTDEDDADTTPCNMWDQSAPQNCQSISLFAGSANIQAVEPMLDAAAVTSGTRMLDIGTGLHAIAVAAALNRGAKPTGTDIGARIVDLAREEYPEVRFETADAAALPFSDESFDAVVIGFSVFAFEAPDKAFVEAHRVLAPGGKFALTTWDWPIAGFDVFHDAMARHVPDEPILPGNRPLMNVSDRDVLIDAIRGAGFVETAIKPLPLIWELESSDQLFDALASLRDFTSVDEQTLQSFRLEVAKASAQYKRGNRYAYPFPALLLSGSKARR